MTNTERQTWQRQQVGDGPCMLLPGQYLVVHGQAPHERRETLELLRQMKYRTQTRDAIQPRNN